jgi:hypothetical protein
MANFLLTFHGGGPMPATKEEQDQVMTAWTDWFGVLGDALVDGGNPISQARAISPDGSVMEATSARAAIRSSRPTASIRRSRCRRLPVLAGGAGPRLETFPVMGACGSGGPEPTR